MRKKLFCCVLAAVLLVGGVAAVAGGNWRNIDVLENDIRVVVNGNQVWQPNFLFNDATYLPLRAVAEIAGMQVQYDAASNTAYLSGGAGGGNADRENYLKNMACMINIMSEYEVFCETAANEATSVPMAFNAIFGNASNKDSIIQGCQDNIEWVRVRFFEELSPNYDSTISKISQNCNLDLTEFNAILDQIDLAVSKLIWAAACVKGYDIGHHPDNHNNGMELYNTGCKNLYDAEKSLNRLKHQYTNMVTDY